MANLFGNISDWLSGGSLGDGLSSLERAAGVAGQTQVPDLASLIPQLQLQVKQGTMTPAQAEAAIQQASAALGLSTDATSDQLEANARLKQLATQGGMSDIDRAQLMEIQNTIAAKNKAAQDAILTDMAQKGQSGSGATQQARLLAGQAGANAGALGGAKVAADAQARALQALQGFTTQSNTLQTNKFNQGKAVADSSDAIARFNAQNRQSTNEANAGRVQAANASNFDMDNKIAGNNVGITNTQRMLPMEAATKTFDQNLARNNAVANALNAQGTALTKQGNTQADTSANWLGAAASAIPSVIGWLSDETKKEDIQPADDSVESMMDKLVGKRFRYKEETGIPGEHVGVMAQDAEKAGLSTADTPDGKMIVDDGKLKGAQLAALSNLHRRVANLESSNG